MAFDSNTTISVLVEDVEVGAPLVQFAAPLQLPELTVDFHVFVVCAKELTLNVKKKKANVNFKTVFIINFLNVMKKMVIIGDVMCMTLMSRNDYRIGGNSRGKDLGTYKYLIVVSTSL